jgi:hypothetical protein
MIIPLMILWFFRKFHRLAVRRSRSRSAAGYSRVEWNIDGSPLWFECGDAELSKRPEAFACLCFAASSLAGWRVRFPERICPVLRRNLKGIDKTWQRWWGGETGRFESRGKRALPPLSGERGEAVFLSLGVDSFYSLLKRPGIGTVIYVAGYDVMLDDTSRLERVEQSLRAVGSRMGLKVIFLRTNLRQHPVFRKMNWEKYHGAALAAVGHLLSPEIRTAVVSSSFPKVFFKPWGTSWKTDHLWSSAAFALEHFGIEHWRLEKLGMIADEPVVREHLRICWEHRTGDLNCGLCEKCQRTMLGLLSFGKLEFYPTFPSVEHLVAGLGKAKPLTAHLLPTYRGFLERGLPPEADAAVRGLMQRSRRAQSLKNKKTS